MGTNIQQNTAQVGHVRFEADEIIVKLNSPRLWRWSWLSWLATGPHMLMTAANVRTNENTGKWFSQTFHCTFFFFYYRK